MGSDVKTRNLSGKKLHKDYRDHKDHKDHRTYESLKTAETTTATKTMKLSTLLLVSSTGLGFVLSPLALDSCSVSRPRSSMKPQHRDEHSQKLSGVETAGFLVNSMPQGVMFSAEYPNTSSSEHLNILESHGLRLQKSFALEYEIVPDHSEGRSSSTWEGTHRLSELTPVLRILSCFRCSSFPNPR